MKKRIVCLLLAITLLSGMMGTSAFAAQNEGLVKADFESGSGLLRYKDDALIDGDPVNTNKKSMKFPETTGMSTLYYFVSNDAAAYKTGRYSLKFDFYSDGTAWETVFRFYDETFGTSKHKNFISFNGAGTLSIARVGNQFYDTSLIGFPFYVNEWNSFEIRFDMDNDEIEYYLNDKLLAKLPLILTVDQINGFAFCKYGYTSEANKNGNFYIDNVELYRENLSNCEYFDPVYIDVNTPADIVGNNFFADNMPEFEISFKNRKNTAAAYNVTYAVKDINGLLVWSDTEAVSLPASGNMVKQLSINEKQFGPMTLSIKVSDETGIYTKEIPYTVSNRTSDMPLNMAYGINISRGRGDAEMAELVADAGIGNVRAWDLAWRDNATYSEDGNATYALTENAKAFLNAVREKNIEYLFLFDEGHDAYVAEKSSTQPVQIRLPFKDKETGLNAMKAYLEWLVKQPEVKGTLKYVEVLNEIHSKITGGVLDYQYLADIHKAVYDGVKAGDKSVKVVGIDEDFYAVEHYDYVSEYLKAMKGTECFDMISIHPYPRLEQENRYFEGSRAADNFTPHVRNALSTNGFESTTPVLFTELGWSDYMLSASETEWDKGERTVAQKKQAAYIVRAHAYNDVKDFAEIVFDYTLSDISNTSKQQSSFGIVNSNSPAGVEYPYLGKPAYCAISYYNNLMADSTFNNEITIDSESYCYSFTDRLGRQVLMLGTLPDGIKKTVKLNVGEDTDSVIVSDMYGNEVTQYTHSGAVEIELSDRPAYIITERTNQVSVVLSSDVAYEEYKVSIEGVCNANDTVEAGIYVRGAESPITSAEFMADAQGTFNKVFTIEGKYEELVAYVKCGSEEMPRIYNITLKDDLVFAEYISEDEELYKYTVTLKRGTERDLTDDVMIMGVYENDIMTDVLVASGSQIDESTNQFRASHRNDSKIIKFLFLENMENIKPIKSCRVFELN